MPSAVIHAFAYDAVRRRLSVTFTSGRRYAYHEVPAGIYEDMRRSFAKGEYFNRHIKDRFAFTAEPWAAPRAARAVERAAGRISVARRPQGRS